MDLSWDNLTPPTETDQILAQFQKAQLTPYKLASYAFFPLTGQGIMSTNLFPVIAPRWSQVTHISATTKMARVYKPEKSPFYCTFARQLCVIRTRLPEWLSASSTLKHSSPLQQALHTQIANHHIQRAGKSF